MPDLIRISSGLVNQQVGTDCVKGQTIFNIKGNRYRLLAVVNYASQTIVVKMLLTHAEYSSGGWQS